MKSQVQQEIERTPQGQPCFRVYGGLILDVKTVKAISAKRDGTIKILFTDGREAVYSGSDVEDVRSLMLRDFTAQ
jgi:exopolysaccharide biosynthesis protein